MTALFWDKLVLVLVRKLYMVDVVSWSFVDWFLIMDATRQSNAQKLFAVIG